MSENVCFSNYHYYCCKMIKEVLSSLAVSLDLLKDSLLEALQLILSTLENDALFLG